MSDFYSILRKSILDRGIAESSERTAIYAQARRAMIRRLWSFDPPLDGDEVERRIAAFDVAVSDIEADVTAAFSEDSDAPAEMEDEVADRRVEAPAYAEEDYGRDEPEADYREPRYREEDYREPRYREADRYADDRYADDRYAADDRDADRYEEDDLPEPEDNPVANPRRLPALIDPVAFGRQVREAGLVRYYESAQRIAPEEPRYDDDARYDAPFEEPEADEPPREVRRASRRQALPEPPIDPYEEEPGYGEEDRAAARRQRQTDRWAGQDPRREARDPPRRKPAKKNDPRRLGPDDDMPRRRQRKRPPPRQPLSDRDKIYMLLGAIGVCVLVLGGIGTYLLLPRDNGVTVAVDHREVSDAATAVRLAAASMPVNQTFTLFDGRDPTVFETSPDNPIHFDAAAGTVRISSSVNSPGVKALIGPGLATRLAGHEVRVTIVARSSKDTGAASMRFAYQSGVAISHWQTANLGPDYQAVALTWRVPAMQTSRAGDLLVIQPGVPGAGTGADIKSIKIDVLAS